MMNKKYVICLLGLLISVCFAACDNEGDSLVKANGYIENTENGTSTAILKGYENPNIEFSVLKPSGFDSPFYINEKSFIGDSYSFIEASESRLDAMTTVPVNENWAETALVTLGNTYWVRYEKPDFYHYLKLRVAYIMGNEIGVEYLIIDTKSEGPNPNSNFRYQSKYPSAMNMETPALNESNQYVAYNVTFNNSQRVNFALEYVAEKKHSAWVAFSFDQWTSQDNVSRKNEWEQDDPNIDNSVEVTESMHKSDGYDKGHLVASEDRVYCRDANRQTFYYANISPQIGVFNQKYWAALEKQVQTWGRSTQQSVYDKVYVTKGGTINKLLTNFTGTLKANDQLYPTTDADGKTVRGLIVPAYYYMAILSEKNGVYKTIGFYVPHAETLPQKPTADDFLVYAVSIDKLEQETGIDFFCNLPNEIEKTVEATYSADDWAW